MSEEKVVLGPGAACCGQECGVCGAPIDGPAAPVEVEEDEHDES